MPIKEPMPQWLQEHIAITTGAPPGTGTLRASRCPDCRAQTLTGLSDDHMAFPVRVDPELLSIMGEVLVRLARRRTYRVVRAGRGFKLNERDRWQLGRNKIGRTEWVVADHECKSSS